MTYYGPPTRFCEGKHPYATKGAALTEAWRLEKRERMPMKVYLCDACHQWHVAHERPLKRTTWRERLGLNDV